MEQLINPNTGKPRKRKAREAPVPFEEGDNTKYVAHAMAIAQMQKIDTDDPAQVERRSIEFFEICAVNDMKPSVAQYANALGTSRRTLYRWIAGQESKSAEARKVMSQYVSIIGGMMEDWMQNGKVNPVSGIFLMKNNFGYQDKTEITIEPKTTNEESLDSIRESAKLLPD